MLAYIGYACGNCDLFKHRTMDKCVTVNSDNLLAVYLFGNNKTRYIASGKSRYSDSIHFTHIHNICFQTVLIGKTVICRIVMTFRVFRVIDLKTVNFCIYCVVILIITAAKIAESMVWDFLYTCRYGYLFKHRTIQKYSIIYCSHRIRYCNTRERFASFKSTAVYLSYRYSVYLGRYNKFLIISVILYDSQCTVTGIRNLHTSLIGKTVASRIAMTFRVFLVVDLKTVDLIITSYI